MTHLPLISILQKTSLFDIPYTTHKRTASAARSLILSLDGNKFILFNLWLRLFLRNIQTKDSVFEGCLNVTLFNFIAYIECTLATAGVTFAADVLLAFIVLFRPARVLSQH